MTTYRAQRLTYLRLTICVPATLPPKGGGLAPANGWGVVRLSGRLNAIGEV